MKHNGKAHEPNQAVRIFGLILFFIGMTVFSVAVFTGEYQLSETVLAELESRFPQERLQKLNPILGQTFDSKFAFLDEIETRINHDGQVQPYQLDQYKLWLTKAATTGLLADNPMTFFLLSIGLISIGALIFILEGRKSLPGIKNDHIFFSAVMNRGVIGILLGIYLIGIYILLYWYPWHMSNLIILTDPLSQFLRSQPADQWFLYGLLYTLAVTVMGVRMFVKYRHSRYHLVRTASVIFFQFGFAFFIPGLLERFNKPAMDFKNAWPLNYTFFMDWNLDRLLSSGNLGLFMLFWGTVLAVIIVPLFAFLFGKRWYCSWVCGCGGLAETLGDPFRHLSDKSLKAWQIERWMVHSVLVVAVGMTVMQIANYISNGSVFGNYTWRVNQIYGFAIGSIFAGVVGTGFYPFMGNRVWCRFGCPLAAILGLVQKFKSRFVITTNGGQCISCGNCSTYCEMGIDVRWYAQRGQNIIRASCVGCGICAAVCPRGVLKLENTSPDQRYNVVLDDELISQGVD